jgi:hypothetical protein
MPLQDHYPSSQQLNFTEIYGSFYDTYAKAYGLPFAIGETGSTGDVATREAWLKAIINPDNDELSNYPLYMSATWFEYCYGSEDGSDVFCVVYKQGSTVVDETISNTENGSA